MNSPITSRITEETATHTVTLTIAGAPTVTGRSPGFGEQTFTVTGARITYYNAQVTAIRLVTSTEDLVTAVDDHERWEQWLRDLVDQHRPAAPVAACRLHTVRPFSTGEFCDKCGHRWDADCHSKAAEQPPAGGCAVAHPDDRTSCEGPRDAVRVVTQHGAEDFGCVHHAARLLASLAGSRVYPGPGAPETAAIEAFNRAQIIEPFAWTRNHEPTTGKEG